MDHEQMMYEESIIQRTEEQARLFRELSLSGAFDQETAKKMTDWLAKPSCTIEQCAEQIDRAFERIDAYHKTQGDSKARQADYARVKKLLFSNVLEEESLDAV